MIENNFVRLLLKDILISGEYTLEGIAYYTNIPQDVFIEVMSGYNKNPSAELMRKIIELHRTVRPNLYRAVVKKITEDYLTAA